MVVSCGVDGRMLFWSFGGVLIGEMEGKSKISADSKAEFEEHKPLSLLRSHTDSGLVAVACDDLSVFVCDFHSHRIIRRFRGHSNRISDLVGSVA